MTGDNHVVWYDLTNGVMWAAFAAPVGTGGHKVRNKGVGGSLC